MRGRFSESSEDSKAWSQSCCIWERSAIWTNLASSPLSDIIEDMRASGTVIFLTELNPEPFELLTRLGVTPRIIDHDHMFRSAEEAVTAAMSARRES